MVSTAESYIGSFISLISKSEIRYEGVVFHINPHDSTIGLKNVTSFGTEGRRKDSPQIRPSETVYEYVYFRGNDLKDLQVLSSAPVLNTTTAPNDPAIIQPSYQDLAAASTYLPPVDAGSVSVASSGAQASPGLTYQGSLSLFQTSRNSEYLNSYSTSNANGIDHSLPLYRQGSNGAAMGFSHLQQPSFLQSLPGSLVSPSQQHQIHHPVSNASLSHATQSFHDISSPLHSSLNNASHNQFVPAACLVLPTNCSEEIPKLMANNQPSKISSSYFSSWVSPLPSSGWDRNTTVPLVDDQSKLPCGSNSPDQNLFLSIPSIVGSSSSSRPETSMPSLVTPGQLLSSGHNTVSLSRLPRPVHKDLITNYQSTVHPTVTLPTSSLLSPLTLSGLGPDAVVPLASERSNSVGHVSSHESTSVSTSSTVETSNQHMIKTSSPSLGNSGQFLQPGLSKLSLSRSLQTQRDIEVVQASAPESLSANIKDASDPEVLSPSLKDSSASSELLSPDSKGGTSLSITPLTSPKKNPKDAVIEKPLTSAKESSGAPLHDQYHNRMREKEKRNGLDGAAVYSYGNRDVNFQPRRHGVNRAASSPRYGRGHNNGRFHGTSRQVTKFAEDFDFEAMNERFNKDEVWGELGRSNKDQPGDANTSNSDNIRHEDAETEAKDLKPAYVKDDFFDSLSCYSFKHKPSKGRIQQTEQRKLDAETFGNTKIRRGRPRGFRYPRYGGQGQAVWSRIT